MAAAELYGDGSGLGVWRNLFTLQKRETDDRRGIARELRDWSLRHGGTRVALYGLTDGDLSLITSVGGGEFPSSFSSTEGEWPVDGNWHRLELPDVVAVYDADGLEAPGEAAAGLLLVVAGARISQLKRLIQEQSFQAMFRGVELEALYEVGLAIGSTLDLEMLGEEVLLRAVLLLDARRGALYLIDFEDGEEGDGVYRLSSRFGGDAKQSFGTDEVDTAALMAERPISLPDILPGAKHLLGVPVELDGKAKGLLLVGDKESRTGVGPFQAKDRRTLSLFANQAAIALENAKLHKLALEKERLEREMEIAAEIQQELLPKAMPSVPGAELLGWNRPARQVGGDYFGFQNIRDDCWTLVVGDVTGKGMPAALLVSTLHSALRLLQEGMEVGPQLVERLNRHIYEASSSNKFITMLLGYFDPTDRSLLYINAGHNPGVLMRSSGEVEELGSGGLPLGLLPMGNYTAGELRLEPGDLVCFYSDGITECEAPDEEQYGLERLVDLLAEARDSSLEEILRRIDDAMLAFADGQPQGDDQTVVLLRCDAD